MPLRAGIVGYPNVGKSTLFNAITQSQVEAANYPFATIQPNVGVVSVPDERVERLAEKFHPLRKVYTTVEFIDIAGLVKGASKGEGLGNQFLSHIRQVDALVHVVRCFDDADITHVEGSVDPLRDIENINLELVMADLQTVENRIQKVERKAQTKDKEAMEEWTLLRRFQSLLLEGKAVRNLALTPQQEKIAASWQLLTRKPVIYVANLAEGDVSCPQQNGYFQQVQQQAQNEQTEAIGICAQLEAELSGLEAQEKAEFLEALGLTESGLDRLIQAAYSLLGLQTFFTAGKQEVRAWTFRRGMLAPECAGIIHSDFQKGFIRAEVYRFEDLMRYQSESALKEKGKLRLEGKDYAVQDGDVLYFRFNV